jgi:hypothetical protein
MLWHVPLFIKYTKNLSQKHIRSRILNKPKQKFQLLQLFIRPFFEHKSYVQLSKPPKLSHIKYTIY